MKEWAFPNGMAAVVAHGDRPRRQDLSNIDYTAQIQNQDAVSVIPSENMPMIPLLRYSLDFLKEV